MFRRKVLKNCILQLQNGFVPEANLKVSLDDLKERPELSWFKTVRPTDGLCNLVGDIKEKKGFGKFRRTIHDKIGNGSCKPSGSDVTEYTLSFLYSTVVNALNVNRKAFKKMFFGRFGYFLTDWEKLGFKDVVQEVGAMWVGRMDESRLPRPTEIVDAVTIREDENADEKNKVIFQKFCDERQDFMIIIKHPVIVKASKAKKLSASNTTFVDSSIEEDEQRPFERSFSLFGVALAMLSEISGIGMNSNTIQVLKYHRKSIVVCYILAICVRRIVQAQDDVTSVCDPPPSDETQAAVQSDADSVRRVPWLCEYDKIENMELCNVIGIGREDGKRCLERVVGGVTEKFYKENHISGGDVVGTPGEAVQGEGDVGPVDSVEIDLDM